MLKKAPYLIFFFVIIVIFISIIPIEVSYATGDSMEPEIFQGEGFIVDKSQTEYDEGEIIKFYSPGTGQYVTHRIVNEKNGKYITKGDNVQTIDQKGPFLPVSKNRIVGKVVEFGGSPITIPYVGEFGPFIVENRIPIFSFLLFVAVYYGIDSKAGRSLRDTKKYRRYYEIFLPFIIIGIVLMTVIILLQSVIMPYNIIYSDSPSTDSRGNLVPVGEEAEVTINVSVNDSPFSYTIVSAKGQYEVSSISNNENGSVLTIKSPPLYETGIKKGEVFVQKYPAILPYEVVSYLHSLNPILAALSCSTILMFIPVTVFIVFHDPYSIIRTQNRGNR